MAKMTKTQVLNSIKESTGAETTPTSVDVAHAMYASASPNLRSTVGDPYETNSLDFMDGLLQYPDTLATEWITLATRIGRSIAHKNIINNKLAPFKMADMPLGYTMEEYFVDVAKEHEYDQEKAETNQFKRELPDIKNAFYIVNRKSYYKQTITDDDLRSYFVTWDGVTSLIARIVDALYNGDNKDDYNYMKSALATHYENGHMKIVSLASPVQDADSAKALAQQLTEYASYLTEPTSEYNGMGVTKQNEMDDLYIILTGKSNSYLNIEWLAQTFQLDIASFKTHVLVIPTLPSTDNGTIEALLVDKEIYRVFDQKYNVTTKYNAEGLYWNYWLHHWEGIATSRFANAIAFVSGSPADKVTAISVKPQSVVLKANQSTKVSVDVTKTSVDTTESITATSSAPTEVTAELSEDKQTLTVSATASATAGLKTVTIKDTTSKVQTILQVVITE